MADQPVKRSYIVRILRSRIIRGVYEGKLPSERVLAEEFGTSPKTVSVALVQLEAQGMVRRTERQGTKVLSGAGRSSDAPILYARLVLENPLLSAGGQFWAGVIICAFQQAAREHHVKMVLEYSDSIDAAVEDAVRESHEPGCVGTCLVGMDLEAKHALRLTMASGPLVLGECTLEEPLNRSLAFDHVDGGRRATEHLLKLGHRRIAFLRILHTPAFSKSGDDRLKGAEEFLRHQGLKLLVAAGKVADAYSILEGLFAGSNQPTAVISGGEGATNFLTAFAANRELRVPRDLSIVSFDDVHASRTPQITLLSWDYEVMGRRLLEMLLDDPTRENPEHVLLPMKLIDHGTTAPPAASS